MTRYIKNIPYYTREERNKFIIDELGDYIGSSVLNVGGGGRKHLKSFLTENQEYIELDIAGKPDYIVNLEKEMPLQFDDNSFETVICTDVLEHVDNLHELFSELERVSSKHIILSLPNGVADSFDIIRNKDSVNKENNTGKHSKFYGLPFQKPVDRHKWIFSYTEAEEFLDYKSKEYNLDILETFGIAYYGVSLKGKLVRFVIEKILGKQMRKHLFCSTIWCVYKKR